MSKIFIQNSTLEVLGELASVGPHQMNHLWMLKMTSLSTKQRFVDAKHLTVKGGRCLVFRPTNMTEKLKLQWVSYDVLNCSMKKEIECYRIVSDISRKIYPGKGFEAVESNTRTVRITLKDGYTVDNMPH